MFKLTKCTSLHFAGSGKDLLYGLWNKPETKDNRVKEYVPEVLEESLMEQHAVLSENTSRDVIVELGHKVLKSIESKAPTPSIAPHINHILKEFGGPQTPLITQRALSYLLYPGSNTNGMNASANAAPHELVATFGDNFRTMVEHIEANGSSYHIKQLEAEEATKELAAGGDGEAADATDTTATPVSTPTATAAVAAAAPKKASLPIGTTVDDTPEPVDVTSLAKLAAGMALANLRCQDSPGALKCVDFALTHSSDRTRRGGLYAMKAGILNTLKRYEEASQVALLAVDTSNNVQGYLHGASALKMLKKDIELVQLLEKGSEQHPTQEAISKQLTTVKKNLKLTITE